MRRLSFALLRTKSAPVLLRNFCKFFCSAATRPGAISNSKLRFNFYLSNVLSFREPLLVFRCRFFLDHLLSVHGISCSVTWVSIIWWFQSATTSTGTTGTRTDGGQWRNTEWLVDCRTSWWETGGLKMRKKRLLNCCRHFFNPVQQQQTIFRYIVHWSLPSFV